MDNDEFRRRVEGFLPEAVSGLLSTVPETSGLFRIVRTPMSEYNSGFVSTSQGSFKDPNTSGNWYANSWQLAEDETLVSEERVYEYSQIMRTVPVLDMSRFPDELSEAIREDRDLPVGSYEKSQIVLSGVRHLCPGVEVSGVVFPSRRGDGVVFTYNPAAVPTKILYSRVQPPGLDFSPEG